MKMNALVKKSSEVLLGNYGRLPIAMARGLNAEIWDTDGKRYIDFFAGFGAAGVSGHCHPKIVDALESQAKELHSHGNFFTNEKQVILAEKLIEHSFPGKVFFCHSGAEANEAAIKLLRKTAGPEKKSIICFDNSFHGRTMGALSITPESFQVGFDPMLEGAVRIPYNNLEAVESAISEDTIGVFMEPIQGEGGVNVPSKEFVKGVRELCTKHNILLVCDEVWTSPARTGKWFAYQHFDITPDVMTLAKAVGGGLPLAAMIVSESFADILGPGTHGCTMGGNPICSAAALASLELIEKQKLVEKAVTMGEVIVAKLTEHSPALVKDVRGKGVMIGLELVETVNPMDIVKKALNHGLFVAPGKKNTIRIAPPLTIEKNILDEGVEILLSLLES